MHHLLCMTLLLLALQACDRRPNAPPAPPAPPAPSAPATAPAEAPRVAQPDGGEDEASFAGEGAVQVTPVEVLHETAGLRLEAQRYRLDGVTGRAFRVRLPRAPRLSVVPSDEVVAFDELLPTDRGPWAAINGGFYAANNPDEPYEAMGLVVSEGEEHHGLTRSGGSGVLFVGEEGLPRIVHRSDFEGEAREALQSIDRIVAGGKNLVRPRPDASSAARSAVVVGREHLWLVTLADDASLVRLDGETEGYRVIGSRQGLPLWAFAEYLLATTDVVDALNMDGAVSTQLAVQDGDYRFELRGVRGTINAVVVRP